MALRSKRSNRPSADDVKSAAENTASEISEQISALRARLEDLVDTLTETGEDRAKDVARHARSAARSAYDHAGRGYDVAADRAVEARDAAARLTSERPALALAVAAGLGVLVGIALFRR